MASSNNKEISHQKTTERFKRRNKRYNANETFFKNRVTGKEKIIDEWEDFDYDNDSKRPKAPSNKAFKLKKQRLNQRLIFEDEDPYF